MSWSPITTADIRIQPAEQGTLNHISGSNTACAAILNMVVGEFVEAIQQGGNQFTSDGTIPDVCRPHVIARTRWLWLCEFPEMKNFQTRERSELNAAAVKFRDAIASGKPKIAPPDHPSPAATTPIVTMPATGRPKLRAFSRWQEDGT